MTGSTRTSDRRIVFWIVGTMFALALAVTLFGPKHVDDDPEPTTYNTGTHGTEAAYLLASELGYKAQRWDVPETDLRNVDAAHTTLILTEPKLPRRDLKIVRAAIEEFLKRGGRVLATGINGALLLPGGGIATPSHLYEGLCYTTPEGDGALAQAGQVPIPEPVHWESKGAEYKVRVEQRCGADAVVVRFRVGDGEAIWWASPMPLTNAGLSGDPSLKLALASLGPRGQTVLFDEYLHTWRDTIQSTIAGLPWWPLVWQCLAAGVLLLVSFSRRNGPLRMPVVLPRTSPIEFAESMGELYHKAGATQAATEAARGRLIAMLREQCGIPREALRAHPPVVAQTLTERFGGEWSELESHMEQAAEAASTALAPKSALKLVQSLDADVGRLQRLRMSVPHSSRSCPMR